MGTHAFYKMLGRCCCKTHPPYCQCSTMQQLTDMPRRIRVRFNYSRPVAAKVILPCDPTAECNSGPPDYYVDCFIEGSDVVGYPYGTNFTNNVKFCEYFDCCEENPDDPDDCWNCQQGMDLDRNLSITQWSHCTAACPDACDAYDIPGCNPAGYTGACESWTTDEIPNSPIETFLNAGVLYFERTSQGDYILDPEYYEPIDLGVDTIEWGAAGSTAYRWTDTPTGGSFREFVYSNGNYYDPDLRYSTIFVVANPNGGTSVGDCTVPGKTNGAGKYDCNASTRYNIRCHNCTNEDQMYPVTAQGINAYLKWEQDEFFPQACVLRIHINILDSVVIGTVCNHTITFPSPSHSDCEPSSGCMPSDYCEGGSCYDSSNPYGGAITCCVWSGTNPSGQSIFTSNGGSLCDFCGVADTDYPTGFCDCQRTYPGCRWWNQTGGTAVGQLYGNTFRICGIGGAPNRVWLKKHTFVPQSPLECWQNPFDPALFAGSWGNTAPDDGNGFSPHYWFVNGVGPMYPPLCNNPLHCDFHNVSRDWSFFSTPSSIDTPTELWDRWYDFQDICQYTVPGSWGPSSFDNPSSAGLIEVVGIDDLGGTGSRQTDDVYVDPALGLGQDS